MKKIILISTLIFVQSSIAQFFQEYKLGGQPSMGGRQAVGDFNNDGFNDIYLSGVPDLFYSCDTNSGSNCNDDELRYPQKILINNKQGGFDELKQPVEFADPKPMHNAFSVITDVDNDNDNDIVHANGDISLNQGNGLFTNVIESSGISLTNLPMYVIDINKDGISEILSSGKLHNRISLNPLRYAVIQDGDVFDTYQQVIDYNFDGYDDIISYGENINITIWINDQTGNFLEQNKIQLDQVEGLKLLAGDIDNDQDIDIVLSNTMILVNNSDTTFDEVALPYLSNTNSNIPINFLNINNDEYLDLEISTDSWTWVLLGQERNDDTEYYGGRVLDINDSSNYFIADFNSDDLDDLIVTYNSSGSPETGVIDLFPDSDFDLTAPFFYSNHPNLHMNDGGGVLPTDYNQAPYSKAELVDFENDGIKDLFFSSYENKFDPITEVTISPTPPFLLENTDFRNVEYKSLDSFVIMDPMQKDVISTAFIFNAIGDFNNNGYDDWLFEYNTYNGENEVITRIFPGSESGINPSNFINVDSHFKYMLNIFYNDIYESFSVADFNGDGYDDIITEKFIIINNDGQSFEKIDIEARTLFVTDLNQDGFADIGINVDGNLSVIYGTSDLTSLSSELIYTFDNTWWQGNIAKADVYDFDFDGDLDLFIIQDDNDQHAIGLLKNTDGNFKTYELFFGTYNIPPFWENQPLTIHDFSIVDLNNDGLSDVITYTNNGDIYNPYISELKIFSTYISENTGLPKYTEIFNKTDLNIIDKDYALIHDFDGDSILDILVNGKMIFNRERAFSTGLSYDPVHSGHGFSIEDVGGNQFYTVFYSYGEDSYPQWYADLGVFEIPQQDYWNITSTSNQLINYLYDYENNSVYQNTEDAFLGNLKHNKCSESYGDISLDFEIGINYFGGPLESDEWCTRPIVDYYQQPENNLSGLWWAGGEDSGWGWSVSLVEREDTTDMVVVLYYYDGEGNARWLIGQQSGFVIGQEITLDMNMVKGYPRASTPTDLEFIPAGTMSLTLNQASNNINQGGVMSIDVTYPGPEGGSWVRDDVPVALFSTPRN